MRTEKQVVDGSNPDNVVDAIPLAEPRSVVLAHKVGAAGAVSHDRYFFAGPENRQAGIAAKVVTREDAFFNPLVLVGPSGTGKTYLARGLAGVWLSNRPESRLVLTTGADFARQTSEPGHAETSGEEPVPICAADLLLLDDLTELVDRTTAQRELIGVLDEVLAHEGKVIITSQAIPSDVSGMLPGLVSRLMQGLLIELAPPGAAVRSLVVQEFGRRNGVAISTDVAEILAGGLPLNFNALHGACRDVLHRAAQQCRPLTP